MQTKKEKGDRPLVVVGAKRPRGPVLVTDGGRIVANLIVVVSPMDINGLRAGSEGNHAIELTVGRVDDE